MELDRESLSLRFGSPEELDAFHRELTALLREMTLSVAAKTKDPEQARALAHEVLREFEVVTRLLNALRAGARSAG